MVIKSKYQKCGKIAERKFREILRGFALDLTTSDTAKLTGISVHSINTVYLKIRQRLCEIGWQEARFAGWIEMDESYFGTRRVRGKRGRGAKDKTIVFSLLKRGDGDYWGCAWDCSASTRQSMIRGKTSIESVIYSDGPRGYHGLVNFGFKKHFRVHHGDNQFVRGQSHINGIESFWGFTKTRLSKFRGVDKSKFILHLKESEFRLNHRDKNLYQILLKEFRKRPLN